MELAKPGYFAKKERKDHSLQEIPRQYLQECRSGHEKACPPEADVVQAVFHIVHPLVPAVPAL